MPDEKEAQRQRADDLRRQIERLRSVPEAADEETAEREPGESPKEYVERRMREISRKKPPGKR